MPNQPAQPVRVLTRKPVAGQPWQIIFANIAAADSLVIEFFGSNGGISRLFPRGRNEMSVTLTPHEPGPLVLAVTLRNKDIDMIGRSFFSFAVLPAGDAALQGTGETPGDAMAMAQAGETVLGPGRKPPYMLPHDSFDGSPPPIPSGTTPTSTNLSEIQRDMQARTDALLNRLTKS